jgi:hypothetical protein
MYYVNPSSLDCNNALYFWGAAFVGADKRKMTVLSKNVL